MKMSRFYNQSAVVLYCIVLYLDPINSHEKHKIDINELYIAPRTFVKLNNSF